MNRMPKADFSVTVLPSRTPYRILTIFIFAALTALFLMTTSCVAQTVTGISVSPETPGYCDDVTVTVRGSFPDVCHSLEGSSY